MLADSEAHALILKSGLLNAYDREETFAAGETERAILRDLGVSSIRLIASRELHYVGLDGFGIAIEATDLLDS